MTSFNCHCDQILVIFAKHCGNFYQKLVPSPISIAIVTIRGQLIFARMGLSFVNSDGGSNFFQHGGSLTK